MFFANSMFYLSGAINVLLFLIIRPKLLLRRPKDLDREEDTGSVIISDTPRFQHSPEPTSAALEDGGPRDIATPFDVNSRRKSEDI
jgi:hypothetical protein